MTELTGPPMPPSTATRWRTVGMVALYALAALMAATVGAVVGKMSYGHIVHDGMIVGEPDAWLLPVAIDGMMVASTAIQAVDRLLGREPRPWAVVGLWLGAMMTLGGNVGSAYTRGFWACVVAMIPAVAFIIVVEMIFRPSRRMLRSARTAIDAAVQTVAPAPVPTPAPVVQVPVPVVPAVPTTLPGYQTVDPMAVKALGPAKPPRVRAGKAPVTPVAPAPAPVTTRKRPSRNPGAGTRSKRTLDIPAPVSETLTSDGEVTRIEQEPVREIDAPPLVTV
jgi:hypothetical protein